MSGKYRFSPPNFVKIASNLMLRSFIFERIWMTYEINIQKAR